MKFGKTGMLLLCFLLKLNICENVSFATFMISGQVSYSLSIKTDFLFEYFSNYVLIFVTYQNPSRWPNQIEPFKHKLIGLSIMDLLIYLKTGKLGIPYFSELISQENFF